MTPRVVYLHGFASSPASSKAQAFARRFAELGIRLEIPDLAEGNFEGLTITGQLQVVERLAGGKPVWLIGSSLGGYLAALYAARHAEARKAVLMAPAFEFARRWRQRLGDREAEAWKRTGYLSVYHYGAGQDRRLGYKFLEDGRQYEDYPAFDQPALVLHGNNDDVVPCELSAEFARRRPNVTLRLFDSDHQLGDVVDLLWDETRRFLFPDEAAPQRRTDCES